MIASDIRGGEPGIDDAQVRMHYCGDSLAGGNRRLRHKCRRNRKHRDVRQYRGTFPARDLKHSIAPDVKMRLKPDSFFACAGAQDGARAGSTGKKARRFIEMRCLPTASTLPLKHQDLGTSFWQLQGNEWNITSVTRMSEEACQRDSLSDGSGTRSRGSVRRTSL